MRTATTFVAALCLVAGLGAQVIHPPQGPPKPELVTGVVPATPPAPELTEVQKLRLQVLAQQMTIAQYKAQQAQEEFTKARDSIAALIQSLQVKDYDLNLETLTYTKKPESTPKAPDTPPAPPKKPGGQDRK